MSSRPSARSYTVRPSTPRRIGEAIQSNACVVGTSVRVKTLGLQSHEGVLLKYTDDMVVLACTNRGWLSSSVAQVVIDRANILTMDKVSL